jgi:DNA-directed RNA polymerase subunit beta
MATKAKSVGKALEATATKRIRKLFGNIHEAVEMPNLIEVQRESYEQFLRSDPSIGYVSGLEKTLRSVFPIRDFAGTAELDFVHYELEAPKYDVDECRQRGITYAAPMKVTLRLIVFEVDSETDTPFGARYQGAGRLHGRHAADDRERHLLRQRHRARHRVADAPFAGCALRP